MVSLLPATMQCYLISVQNSFRINQVIEVKLYCKSENVHSRHLSSLCGCSKAWVDSIKFPNSHHARVNLVVQLQSEYGDQHGA